MKPSVTLYPYQETGRDFILEHRYVLLGDEMGLGKTIQALAVADEVIGSVIVVCPAMLRATWLKEISKFTYLKEVVVVSYEGLGKLLPVPDIEMVIFDEAHYLKNLLAKRTQRAHDFIAVHKPKYCVLLTGTPLRNGVGEFYSLLKLLTKVPGTPNGLSIKEKSQYAFNLQFSNASFEKIRVKGGEMKSIAKFSGVRNKPALRMYLKGKYLRRTADTVLSLPSLTSTFVDLSTKGKNPDKALYQAYEDWLYTGKLTDHVTHLKMTSAMAKVAYSVPFVRNMVEQGESVVVFTDHVDPALALVKGISEGLCSVGCITGSVSQEDRADLIEQFQAGTIKVLVCTIRSAGVGITLTASRIVVFNDISWVPADIEQARKRIHRIGQDKPCMIYHVTQGAFDEALQKTVMRKAELVKEIL